MKNLWMLKETNTWTKGPRIVAVCTSLDKAVKMMEEWYEEEKEEKGKNEDIEASFEKDGQYSLASIASKESNAWEELDIVEGWTDDWLNNY